MNNTKPSHLDKQGVVAPSLKEWEMIGAKLSFKAEIEISGYNQQSGEFFYHKGDLLSGSLDLLESVNTNSHSMVVGGVMEVEKDIVCKFFEDSNIEMIFSQSEGLDINLLLVYKEEVDEIALRFAKIQNNVSRQYPKYQVEILYIPSNLFSEDFIPVGSVRHLRG